MLDGIRSNAHSFWVKLAFGIIILVFVFWGIGARQSPSGIVASVNGENISVKEFQSAYARLDQQVREALPGATPEMIEQLNIEQQALQSLVTEKLIAADARRAGVEVSAWDIRRAVEQMPYFLNDQGKFDPEVYKKVLEQSGQNAADFEGSVAKQALPRKVARLLSSGKDVSDLSAFRMYQYQNDQRSAEYVLFPYDREGQSVTDEEIKNAYEARAVEFAVAPRVRIEYIALDPEAMGDENAVTEEQLKNAYAARQGAFTVPERMRARHLLIMVPENADAQTAAKALERIQALRARIVAGESFESVAAEAGEDGTAKDGGELGWFTKRQMVPAFADAAFALNPGDLSEPVLSPFGYHLILAEEKEAEHVRSFDEVKDELRKTLASETAGAGLQDAADNVLASVLGGADLDAAAAKAGLSKADSGLMTAEQMASALAVRPSDVQIFMNTAAGTVLDVPVSMGSALAIVKVAEVLPQMTRPLDEVRDTIAGDLKLQKAQDAAMAEARRIRGAMKGNELPEGVESAESDYFTRSGQIPGIGMVPQLSAALFSAAEDSKDWLPEAYPGTDGAVLARLSGVRPADREQFERIKDSIKAAMLPVEQQRVYNAYVYGLQQDAKVSIRMPQIFERKNAE
ncbi:MAG: SurA N-terminal domain-containing protein [Mailhella sp.]|nr:SurA N-terminal domain-containing protein [Mailhella sp.]